MREKFINSKIELKEIQFYLENDIVLEKKDDSEEINTSNGIVNLDNDVKVNQIIIEKHTPGVLYKSVNNKLIQVSFDDKNFLHFGAIKNDKDKDRTYNIFANDWEDGVGTITYGKDEYKIKRKDGTNVGHTILKIKQGELTKTEKEIRIATGVQIDK